MAETAREMFQRNQNSGLTDHERFWEKVDTSGECWEWRGGLSNHGYGSFSINGTVVKAHRAVIGLIGIEIPDGLHVLHRCDNRPCVRPSHLYFGTNQDNIADRVERGCGVVPRGQAKGNHKLTEDQVREIRKILSRGVITQLDISKRYGVSPSTIWKIANGRSWTHVETKPSLSGTRSLPPGRR